MEATLKAMQVQAHHAFYDEGVKKLNLDFLLDMKNFLLARA